MPAQEASAGSFTLPPAGESAGNSRPMGGLVPPHEATSSQNARDPRTTSSAAAAPPLPSSSVRFSAAAAESRKTVGFRRLLKHYKLIPRVGRRRLPDFLQRELGRVMKEPSAQDSEELIGAVKFFLERRGRGLHQYVRDTDPVPLEKFSFGRGRGMPPLVPDGPLLDKLKSSAFQAAVGSGLVREPPREGWAQRLYDDPATRKDFTKVVVGMLTSILKMKEAQASNYFRNSFRKKLGIRTPPNDAAQQGHQGSPAPSRKESVANATSNRGDAGEALSTSQLETPCSRNGSDHDSVSLAAKNGIPPEIPVAVSGSGTGSLSEGNEASAKRNEKFGLRASSATPSRFPTHEIVTDERPRRMYNPLLRMPQWPARPGTPGSARPDPAEVPQAAELWHLADLHFALPDTYPIGYLARVLGFDVPETGIGQEFGAPFDVASLCKMKCGDEETAMAPAGPFADQCWTAPDAVGGVGDDQLLSYCDPQWANILASYRGSNGGDFKDAGKGYTDVLSEPCLDYARERGVLPKEGGLTFRFAGEEDEAMLRSLAEKCRWTSNGKSDVAGSLRSQGHFLVVAEAAPQKEGCREPPVAFLQYRFCWYKVEDKRMAAGVSTDKVSELVVHLDNLVCAADGGDRNHVETVQVLLTSLALVHAARVDVWYGMTDAPAEIAPLLTKYFRMSDVSRGEKFDNEAVRGTVPLVFDIKKCHYRYSILLLEESLKSERRERSRGAGRERMIVNLKHETTPTHAHLDAATRTQPGHGVFGNSNATSSQTKTAHVRLVTNSDAGANAELFSVSAAAAEEGEAAKEVANPIDLSSLETSAAHWNVMRTFPVGVEGEEGGDSGDAYDDNVFMTELKKKQAKLQELESSIEMSSRDIISKAYDEQTAFVTGSHRAELEADNKKLAEYKEVITRQLEANLAWEAQRDQDMDAECDVCFDGEVTPHNPIVFCDACNVAVHQRCYGIDKIPSGNFFCHTCTYFELDKEYLANRRRQGSPPKITRHAIICELCPRRQGAFVQVQTLVPTKKAKWVHVGCAKWQGVNYVDSELKDKIEDLTQLKQYFEVQGLACHRCKIGIGALHQCRVKGCEKWFHLPCARSFGKSSVQHGENCEGCYNIEDIDNPPWTLACPKHSNVDQVDG